MNSSSCALLSTRGFRAAFICILWPKPPEKSFAEPVGGGILAEFHQYSQLCPDFESNIQVRAEFSRAGLIGEEGERFKFVLLAGKKKSEALKMQVSSSF